MDCLSSTVKYILYVFNLVFVIIGVLLIILGSIALSNVGSLQSFDDAVNTALVPIIILVLGIIIFLIAFFGCCGTIKDNICLMSMYSICLGIIIALTLALVIWAFGWMNVFLDTMRDFVQTAWEKNTQANGYPMTSFQNIFDCCGLNSYTDYNGTVPTSCCGKTAVICDASVYQQRPGCQEAFIQFWTTNIKIVRYAGIAVVAIEVVILMFTTCVTNAMRRSRQLR